MIIECVQILEFAFVFKNVCFFEHWFWMHAERVEH